MNSTQDNKQGMYLASDEYLTINTAIVTPLPGYSGYSTLFKNSIAAIQNYSEQQQFNKSGIAENKKQARNTLATIAIDNSRKLTAYATNNNNQVLLNETKYSESELKRCPDTELRDIAQGLYKRIQSNLTALAPYGVTAASQTAFQTAITNFITAIPKTRVGRAETKQNTIHLRKLFKIADDALEHIDTLIEIVRQTQPNFYNGYKSVRKVIRNSGGTLSLKGLVTDLMTGEPIKGAILEFAIDGKSVKSKVARINEMMIKKTADKGRFNIKTMPSGVYSVTIKKVGYADHTTTVAVADGELTELNISLSKN